MNINTKLPSQDVTDGLIQNIELQTFKQNFKVLKENKMKFGEVNTPFHLIFTMLDMLPKYLFNDETIHWIDPACGCGYFPMVLYNKLRITLMNTIKSVPIRNQHIIEKMISMVELNNEHIPELYSIFGKNANIYNNDFLNIQKTHEIFNKHILCESPTKQVKTKSRMVIIGNPPYNSQGLKKVPTNTKQDKKKDGKTVWTDFVRHSINVMNIGDFLVFIIPSIWMKPDRAKIYDLFMSYKVHRIRTYSNTQTAKIFRYQAQTPTCIVVMEKIPTDFQTEIYDTTSASFVKHNLRVGRPIPLCNISIINKMLPLIEKYGSVKVKKTNMPSKSNKLLRISSNNTELNDDLKKIYPYVNIRTCCLINNSPELKFDYSSKPCSYYGEKKVVLAHKMYGHPFVDISGAYGISNRDNYVLLNLENDADYYRMKDYLNLPIIQKIYDSTRYRMRYLERYAFEFIPDIMNEPSLYDMLRDLSDIAE